MKFNYAFKLSLIAIICLTTLGGCTKGTYSGLGFKDLLMGSWTETPPYPDFNRTIFFNIDDTFTLHIKNSLPPLHTLTITGTYSIDGNKLIVKANEMTNAEAGKQPMVTKFNGEVFDKATFKIDGNNKLTLDYFTYPADGPVPTTTKFVKN